MLSSLEFATNDAEHKKHPILWTEMPYWWERIEEISQSVSDWQGINSKYKNTLYNTVVSPSCVISRKLWRRMHGTQQ